MDNPAQLINNFKMLSGQNTLEPRFTNLDNKGHKRIIFDQESKVIFFIILCFQLSLIHI